MMMLVGCNTLVQLARMNKIRISRCLAFIHPRNSFDLCTN